MLRLATFNVNSVRSRLPILERWLPSSNVDVLLLQETKAQDVDFPAGFFTALGYTPYFCGEKTYNGVAAIVKNSSQCTDWANVNVTFGFNDGQVPNFDTRVCLVRLKCNTNREIVILNTYVPQGKSIDHIDFDVKKNFLARVRDVIEHEIKNAFVWTGDLNVAPTDIDVTHPENKRNHVCCCADIRSCFETTVDGLTDMLRKFHPNESLFTFFDYRLKDALTRNVGWRIDHFFSSPTLADLAVDCFVELEPRGWERPSDHTPLVLDLKV